MGQGDTNAADVIVFGGGGGMFGHVAVAALRRDHSVIATARHAMADCVPFDVDAPDDALAAITQRARPQGLILNAIATTAAQMAAPATSERAYAVNATFPHRLARVAAARDQRVIQISTDAVFSPDCGTVSEDDAISPRDAYGRSKAEGELTGAHCLTIRCSIVGPAAPQRRSGLWAWVADQARSASIAGYVNQIWSGMTTRQLAAVCAALVDCDRFAKVRAAGPVHHLAPNPAITKFDLVHALAALLRPDVTVRPADAPQPIDRILASRHRLLDAFTPRWPTWPETLAAANRN